MSFSEFLEDRVRFLIVCALFLSAQACLLFAMGNEIFLIVVLSLLWFTVFSVYMVLEYHRKNKRMKHLEQMSAELDQKYLLHEVFPKGGSSEEQFYKQLLYIGNKSMLEHVSNVKRERIAYQEYIEQWVHEIKTPIAAMKLWSENQAGEKKRSGLTQIERIEHYVEQALYYARSASVEKDLRIQPIDLKDCVQESFLQCKYLCTSSHVQVDIAPIDQMVLSDEKWLIFILNQVIENAVKYRSDENARIWIDMQEGIDSVTLQIHDNGKGIRANDLPRVFEKGFTGENGRTANRHATGIGLYLCKTLCTALHIEMKLNSIVHEGTTVSIQIHK